MTLCELLHAAEWSDIRPYLERQLSTESTPLPLADYERWFEYLKSLAPDYRNHPETFRFFPNSAVPFDRSWNNIAHDTIDCNRRLEVGHAFGASWPICLATNLQQEHLDLSIAEWAAYCLWCMIDTKYSLEDINIMNLRTPYQSGILQRMIGKWNRYLSINMTRPRIKRICQSLPPTNAVQFRKQVRRVEKKILRITGMNPDDFRWTRSQRKIERVGELIGERKALLDRMFAGTPEEVARMERVNGLLFDLTQQMYRRSAALYRKVLTATYDPAFDDDVTVEGTLKYNCDGDESVLCMTNDGYYGSDFGRMLRIIDWLYVRECDGFRLPEIERTICKSMESDDRPNMRDEEFGFENSLDDGTTWAEGALWHPAVKHICICHAVHDICTHKSYSIPDLLRMNDFWCEVKVVHQHIVEQDGSRMGWWERCTFEEFRDKMLAEAEHRPACYRFGQYIANRTVQLFPMTALAICSGANNCFHDDAKVDAYLHDIFEQLRALHQY